MKKVTLPISYCTTGKNGVLTSRTIKLDFRFIDKRDPELRPLYLRALELAEFSDDNKASLYEHSFRNMKDDFILGLSCSRFVRHKIREILLDAVAVYNLNCQIANTILRHLYETDTLEVIHQVAYVDSQTRKNLNCYLQTHGSFAVYRKYIELLFSYKEECLESAHLSAINLMADYYRSLYD